MNRWRIRAERQIPYTNGSSRKLPKNMVTEIKNVSGWAHE